MNKIVIVGSSGTGKTTLARNLRAILKIAILKMNVYHLDRVFWKRGWERRATEERIDIAQAIVLRKRWIIEGNYPDSSEPCLYAADTIIFLDVPLLLCLRRLVKRHNKDVGLRRRDLPMDCTDRLTFQSIMKVLSFKLTKRGPIMQKLKIYKAEGKEIIIFRSTKQVDEFVAQQLQLVHNKEHASTLVPVG